MPDRIVLTADEQLRVEALQAAVRTADTGDTMYEVKDRARKYYDFLSERR
jgi:hypothetical protein